MIVWINGTHGVGKTTTAALVQSRISDSRVFDAEKVGETLMDIWPGLPTTDNFPMTEAELRQAWRTFQAPSARELSEVDTYALHAGGLD